MNAQKAGLVLLVILGCGEDEPPSQAPFDCTVDRHDWRRCEGDWVWWCHGLGEPHFHAVQDCGADNQICVSQAQTAYCADPGSSCTEAAGRCDGDTATNCLDGLRTYEPCSVHETCALDDQWARCVPL